MKTLLLVVALFVSSNLFSQTSQKSTVEEYGAKGTLEWKTEKSGISEIVIWEYESKDGGKSGWGGKINKGTRIMIMNKEISYKNLDLLEGKKVLAYMKYVQDFQGEGSSNICREIDIYVLPSDKVKF